MESYIKSINLPYDYNHGRPYITIPYVNINWNAVFRDESTTDFEYIVLINKVPYDMMAREIDEYIDEEIFILRPWW